MRGTRGIIIGMLIGCAPWPAHAVGRDKLLSKAIQQQLAANSHMMDRICAQVAEEECGLYQVEHKQLLQDFYSGVGFYSRHPGDFAGKSPLDVLAQLCPRGKANNENYDVFLVLEDSNKSRLVAFMAGVEQAMLYAQQTASAQLDSSCSVSGAWREGMKYGFYLGVTACVMCGITVMYDKVTKAKQRKSGGIFL